MSTRRSPAAAVSTFPAHGRSGAAAPSPRLRPIVNRESFKGRAYVALKDAIVAMDVYRSRADIRLDERRLASDLGVSRTPVREAMAQLEREGFVRAIPRRGIARVHAPSHAGMQARFCFILPVRTHGS